MWQRPAMYIDTCYSSIVNNFTLNLFKEMSNVANASLETDALWSAIVRNSWDTEVAQEEQDDDDCFK